jgi:hypothetical protein
MMSVASRLRVKLKSSEVVFGWMLGKSASLALFQSGLFDQAVHGWDGVEYHGSLTPWVNFQKNCGLE